MNNYFEEKASCSQSNANIDSNCNNSFNARKTSTSSFETETDFAIKSIEKVKNQLFFEPDPLIFQDIYVSTSYLSHRFRNQFIRIRNTLTDKEAFIKTHNIDEIPSYKPVNQIYEPKDLYSQINDSVKLKFNPNFDNNKSEEGCKTSDSSVLERVSSDLLLFPELEYN
jgi:hypothetical protein